MDIIVTTPKHEMANAAREAADCIRAGGGEYFRRFSARQAPCIRPGEWVWYVEDGYLRGGCQVTRVEVNPTTVCATTGRSWPPGLYVFMDASTWVWFLPLPMKGFRGFRYAIPANLPSGARIVRAGGWRDPRPAVP